MIEPTAENNISEEVLKGAGGAYVRNTNMTLYYSNKKSLIMVKMVTTHLSPSLPDYQETNKLKIKPKTKGHSANL